MNGERYTRYETLESWFFPGTTRENGHMVPAPNKVVEFYKELRDGWLKNHLRTREKPSVSMHPTEQNNQEGWIVETGIYIPPLKEIQTINPIPW